MMVSVNLLPDSKLAASKATKLQRTLAAGAFIAILIGLGVPIVLAIIWGGQKGILTLTQRNIDNHIKQIKDTEDLELALTVQNHLSKYKSLDEQRTYYNSILAQLPSVLTEQIKTTGFKFTEEGYIEFSGTAPSLKDVNDFANILKAAQLVNKDTSEPAFSEILLEVAPSGEGATFSVNMNFNKRFLLENRDYNIVVGNKIVLGGKN